MRLTKQHRHYGDMIYKELNHLFDEQVTLLQGIRECSFAAKKIIAALRYKERKITAANSRSPKQRKLTKD